jgi:uncharacterized protein YndB with AHSA1/START domain
MRWMPSFGKTPDTYQETKRMNIDIPLETHVERRFAAPPERVFRAWTTPGELCQWFRVDTTSACRCEVLDVRAGGRYAIQMTGAKGVRTVSGEYLEVSPPNRLVFTWLWDGHPDEKKTVVTIQIEPTSDGGSTLALKHARFPDQNMADEHKKGWTMIFGTLAGWLEAKP